MNGEATQRPRSTAELQTQLDELIGASNEGGSTCLIKDLPRLISQFEAKRGLVLLEDDTKQALDGFIADHADISVSSEQLVQLLGALTPSHNRPPSPSASDSDSSVTADFTARGVIEDEVLDAQHTPTPIMARQRSNPLSNSTSASKIARPSRPKSRRISSERSSSSSPPLGNEHRAKSPMSDDSLLEEEEPLYMPTKSFAARLSMGRSTTSTSIPRPKVHRASYSMPDHSLIETSPPAGIDDTSYYPTPKSPPPERSFAVFGLDTPSPAHSREVSATSSRPSEYLGEAFGSVNRAPSASSLHSINSLSEKVENLSQELRRKNEELEKLREENEWTVAEKEAVLDEMKAELATKKREEKELRSKEKLNLQQIADLEARTTHFKDEGEKQRQAHQAARRQFEDQCAESEKLRDIIRDKTAELALTDEHLQNSLSEINKVMRERDFLQSSVTRLEEELASAREAAVHLEEQKHENLALKETIDRLRYDLDQARAAGKTFVNGSGDKDSTLSRNLGTELSKRLKDAFNDPAEGNTPQQDGSFVEETVVTTRRMKRAARSTISAGSNSTSTATPSEQDPAMQTIDDIVSLTSRGIQAEPTTSEIATQTEPHLLPKQIVEVIKEIQIQPPVLSKAEREEKLARELGIEIDALQQYIDRQKASVHEPPPPYAAAFDRFASRLPRRALNSTYLTALYEAATSNSSTFCIYSFALLVAGLLVGGHWLSPHRGTIHLFQGNAVVLAGSDRAKWLAMNTLDYSNYHAAEGIRYWLDRFIWDSVSVASKVPT